MDEGVNFLGSNQHTKEAKFIMTITKIAAIVALATAALSLGACCQGSASPDAVSCAHADSAAAISHAVLELRCRTYSEASIRS